MIAPSPSLDVLRHGWLDAVASLAPDHPALAELLDQRLRDAVATGRLSEEDLLATVVEVEGAAVAAEVPAVAPLAMRLRRTVYEYLLAVDATSAVESQLGAAGSPSGAPFHIVDDEADAPPAWSHDTGTEPDAGDAAAEPEAVFAEPADAEPTEETWTEAAPGTAEQGPADDAEPAPEAEPEPAAAADDQATDSLPFARFRVRRHHHDDFVDPAAMDEAEDIPAAVASPPLPPAQPPAVEPVTESLQPVAADPEPPAAATNSFVAPRAGFHITDDAQVFAEVERPELPPSADFDPSALAGWRVRENTAEARRDAEARGDALRAITDQSEDPFDTDSGLFEERRRIEDRLRRKKCDEAAAMLQSLAQETGGRAVAELAMDAGDRCRGLGKTNAALNCYLAASRADPIFELPLHRLADICIDDQDIDLAVSYLERIARLHQLRGDSTGALRVYRRIVTVAPYREDILAMLMNARTTGQLPS